MADADKPILERHLRALLATRKRSWFKRRSLRKSLMTDLWAAGRPPKRAKYIVRHTRAQERKIRRGYLLDGAGNPNLDAAIHRAVETILRRVPDTPGRPGSG
ncbi:MAG: hypothetical protein ACYDBQ_00570 [Thermoplasmatota archaeon]